MPPIRWSYEYGIISNLMFRGANKMCEPLLINSMTLTDFRIQVYSLLCFSFSEKSNTNKQLYTDGQHSIVFGNHGFLQIKHTKT